jgi:hypothetical protein
VPSPKSSGWVSSHNLSTHRGLKAVCANCAPAKITISLPVFFFSSSMSGANCFSVSRLFVYAST